MESAAALQHLSERQRQRLRRQREVPAESALRWWCGGAKKRWRGEGRNHSFLRCVDLSVKSEVVRVLIRGSTAQHRLCCDLSECE